MGNRIGAPDFHGFAPFCERVGQVSIARMGWPKAAHAGNRNSSNPFIREDPRPIVFAVIFPKAKQLKKLMTLPRLSFSANVCKRALLPAIKTICPTPVNTIKPGDKYALREKENTIKATLKRTAPWVSY